ncbi:MAG TPA: hypothetical protein PLJ27_15155 [Polyangiaceae bacterium]|nr:MAG: hypothetical protein BWY17_01200 [Deltaproteobacteria bacterium ADurb.Bin207]HNS96940.1 hypothetical protein [Polyangiaceae bacterium]HNZ21273.1 hypothetical protein [Polyangiaceae bacterium]HOD21041.1 hypothetical protein [Polyangiaceae bacterium]HOE48661.1 hypothetical protein [Polyangiaceae bacterium]
MRLFSRPVRMSRKPTKTTRTGHYALLFARALVVGIFLSWGSRVQAADTSETFAVGVTDVEWYSGVDRVEGGAKDRTVFADMMLGIGLLHRLSAYTGVVMQGTGAFTEGQSSQYMGLLGTPLDTDHCDLDLQLDVSSGGPSQQFELRPAFELNVDGDPQMRSWGVYVRAPFPVYGRKMGNGRTHATFHLELTVGAYAHLIDGHQVLIEGDAACHPEPEQGEQRYEMGGVALGYNVEVSDALELISQLYFDVPQAHESVSTGVMLGLIGTLPSPLATNP